MMRELARGLVERVRQRGVPVELRTGKRFQTRRGLMRLYSAIHVQWAGRPEYSLIDFSDIITAKGNPVVRETVPDEDCQLVLKGQYRAKLYSQPPFMKIRPYTYFEMDPRLFQKLRPELCRVEKRLDRLYFRGSG
jgi:hypothetical protein